jgi:hypothetical protein
MRGLTNWLRRVQTLHLLDLSLYLACCIVWSSEQSGTGWRENIECWKSSKDCKHSKAFVEGPQQGRATKLLSMSRQQLSTVVGLLTGHLGLYGHLRRIGKDITPLCRRCLNGNETVEHLLCECENLTISWGCIFGQSSELQQLSHVPVNLLTVCHRNRTSLEIIVGGAQ